MLQALEDGAIHRLTTFVDGSVRHVAWDAMGESIVFFADSQGDEKESIYLMDADGREAPRELTKNPDARFAPADGPPFSPDGRWMAYAGNDRVSQDQDVLLYDTVTGQTRRVYSGGGRVYAGFWSPDGRRLTVAERRTTNSDHVVHVVSVDEDVPAVSLTRQDLAHNYWLGPWLPDGSGFLVLSNYGREFTGLAVMDATNGSLSWWDIPDWDIEEVALSSNGRIAAWNIHVDGFSQIRARDVVSGRNFDVLAGTAAGWGTGLTLSPDGGQALLRLSTPTRPWNVAAVELTSGEVRWLTNARPTNTDPASFVEPALVRYPSSDGQQHIPGFLYRPSGSGKRAGVVISIHGGPSWYERPAYLYDGFYQYLLSQGIGVFGPNVRGSLGYGKVSEEAVHRDWGGVDLVDFADAVTYLRSLDWVDPERIGLFGASYGGFAVLSCLSRLPELSWAAGVDFYGPSNLVTLAKASPPTWRKIVEANFGDPERDAERLMQRSPVTYADRIAAPLLVVQGANDPRVPRSESDQIVERLRSRGVPTQYEVFLDEGHGFTKRQNQDRAFSLAGTFLSQYLAG